MASKVKYPIDLKSSTIVVAVAQIEGPLPNGKHQALVGDRDSLAWKSSEEINARINKACEVLDALNSRPSTKANLVVFPEYSLPVEKALPRLHEKANQYNQIIVGGSDSIQSPKTRHIYNRCPIVIPHRKKPLWVTKRRLSKFEQGLIDEPVQVSVPVLTWQADGRSYWLSVYICLDFMLAPRETRKGGGVFIVPMCSSDVNSFRGWASDALRLENGTATVLCNCVGDEAAGQSGIVAVVSSGKPFKSAFDLPETEEAVAIFEIDCKRLAPPKVTSPYLKYPLGKRRAYSLLTASGRVELSRLTYDEKDVITRGVVNPALFKYLGKRMRIAFLSLDENFSEAIHKLKNQDFEVLATLGPHDLMITHLHQDLYDMVYDIEQVVKWKPTDTDIVKRIDETLENKSINLPFFQVDVYFKVLGVRVDAKHRSVFEGANHRVPSLQERVQILKLGSDWNDEDVLEEEREKFTKNKWILQSTDKEPGKINFVMTISLNHADHQEERLATFEYRVIPELVKKSPVTSLYRGKSQMLGVEYVLRLSTDVDSLYLLIEDIYRLAAEARVSITTTTYVVLKRLSNLALEKAVLTPTLTDEETNFRNTFVRPVLSRDNRARLVFLPPEMQREFIKRYRAVLDALNELHENQWFPEQAEEIKRKVANGLLGFHEEPDEIKRRLESGLLDENFLLLRQAHDTFQVKVETLLKNFIRDEVSDGQLDSWRTSLNIPSGRKKANLSFTERIKVVTKHIEIAGQYMKLLTSAEALNKTVQVRNALIHTDWDRFTLDEYILVLQLYCRFLIEIGQSEGVTANHYGHIVGY